MLFIRLLPAALLLLSCLPAFTQDRQPDYRKKHRDQYAMAQDQIVIPDSQTEIAWLPGGEFITGSVCYNIRSYVVARDDRDSDSTHPVKFSTCQPANRFHLKNTEKPEIR